MFIRHRRPTQPLRRPGDRRKGGIADLLIIAGVGDRHDVAIIGNEGQSVEAELRLADALGVPIFVLHDFDRTGLTICQNLREGTWRYRYRNQLEVIEIGLRLDQVAGLPLVWSPSELIVPA